ncbi:hypothetical protein LZ32DRAFT_599361 [Colletotrichum eremochloae]|nr:hypothetical protein LZ32DRAFT_599361 [Colletotrichum eremochloae]
MSPARFDGPFWLLAAKSAVALLRIAIVLRLTRDEFLQLLPLTCITGNPVPAV